MIQTQSKFDFFASTGRTATTYIASCLAALDGVAGCHEGYMGMHKDSDPVLPQINLENAQAYSSAKAAKTIVQEKRSAEVIEAALAHSARDRIIDVAYYNATLCSALLAQHPACKMIGIIRNCEDFVRSSTTLNGEDPLPVGWPDRAKDLTAREKFIGMGRIRPRRGSEAKSTWDDWGAIRRNIWLWAETNRLLCEAKVAFPDRVSLVRFETFKTSPAEFWDFVSRTLDLQNLSGDPSPDGRKAINKKPFDYQVGPLADWSTQDRTACIDAQKTIDESVVYDI